MIEVQAALVSGARGTMRNWSLSQIDDEDSSLLKSNAVSTRRNIPEASKIGGQDIVRQVRKFAKCEY
jgi:hypothetical protein